MRREGAAMRRILYCPGTSPHDRGRSAMTTLYGISNFDTVKKARAWLDVKGIAYHFV